MLDLRLYDALDPLPSYSGDQLENSDDASRIGKREVEIDIVNSPAIDLADEVFTDSTENKLTILILRLMEGDDIVALKREYGTLSSLRMRSLRWRTAYEKAVLGMMRESWES